MEDGERDGFAMKQALLKGNRYLKAPWSVHDRRPIYMERRNLVETVVEEGKIWGD
jgi:hypothetical protein